MDKPITLQALGPLADIPRGRLGRADGPVGVRAWPIPDLAMVSLVARKGGDPGAPARDYLGCDMPNGPRRTGKDSLTMLGVGPGRWLLIDASGRNDFASDLASHFSGAASIADQTGGYAVIAVSGPKARAALAKGVTIDLHPRIFTTQSVAVSQIANIGAIVWLTDPAPVFHLAVFRSAAGSAWRWLCDSAAEFGLDVSAP